MMIKYDKDNISKVADNIYHLIEDPYHGITLTNKEATNAHGFVENCMNIEGTMEEFSGSKLKPSLTELETLVAYLSEWYEQYKYSFLLRKYFEYHFRFKVCTKTMLAHNMKNDMVFSAVSGALQSLISLLILSTKGKD